MARDIGDDGRLGGPPGLYDSANSDRGGLVQRIRVPADPRPEAMFPWGSTSLNDSDNDSTLIGHESAPASKGDINMGVSLRRTINGDDM